VRSKKSKIMVLSKNKKAQTQAEKLFRKQHIKCLTPGGQKAKPNHVGNSKGRVLEIKQKKGTAKRCALPWLRAFSCGRTSQCDTRGWQESLCPVPSLTARGLKFGKTAGIPSYTTSSSSPASLASPSRSCCSC